MSNHKPNLVDRLVGYISPRQGLRRAKDRASFSTLASGGRHSGGKTTRRGLRQWQTGGASSDSDDLPSLDNMRNNSRDLTVNAPLASGAISTTVTNVVGSGLRPQPHIDRDYLGLDEATADRIERDFARAFRFWANSVNCDAARMQKFAGLQSLAMRAVLEGGDVLVLKLFIEHESWPFGQALQFVEAERISNSNNIADTAKLAGGVEVDTYGAPVKFHIMRGYPRDRLHHDRTWDVVSAFNEKTGLQNVIHLFDKRRPGQRRGIPYLGPVIETLKQLDRYSEAELMAAVINSCFAIGMRTDEGDATEGLEKGVTDDIRIVEPGQIYDLADGEEIESFDPARPSGNFEPFFQAIVRQIGVALEMPYEVLIKHFTSSYSASRAAIEQAWVFFRNRRTWLATMLCAPCYEGVIIEAVASGMIKAPGNWRDPLVRAAYLGAEWIGPAKLQIDELKEMRAAELKIDLGVSTLSAETAQITGGDWENNHGQSVKEKKVRVAGGLEEPIKGAARRPADGRTEDQAAKDLADGLDDAADEDPAPKQERGNYENSV